MGQIKAVVLRARKCGQAAATSRERSGRHPCGCWLRLGVAGRHQVSPQGSSWPLLTWLSGTLCKRPLSSAVTPAGVTKTRRLSGAWPRLRLELPAAPSGSQASAQAGDVGCGSGPRTKVCVLNCMQILLSWQRLASCLPKNDPGTEPFRIG